MRFCKNIKVFYKNKIERTRKMEKKISLHYYFTYVYLCGFCFKNYGTFKEFVDMGPAFLSNILVGMWKGLLESTPERFIHTELPANAPFTFSIDKVDDEKKLFFIHMPRPQIVPEAFDICIVMYNNTMRYFALESDNSHIFKIKSGMPKEQCHPKLFISEWFADGSHKNFGSILITKDVRAVFANKIKQECNIF